MCDAHAFSGSVGSGSPREGNPWHGIWPKRVCFAEFQGLESETGNNTSIFNVFNRVYFSVNKCERAGDGRSTLTFCGINNIYVKRTNPMMLV